MEETCTAIPLDGRGVIPTEPDPGPSPGGWGSTRVPPRGGHPEERGPRAASERKVWVPPPLPHLRVKVRLRAKLLCRLPPFQGSTLRGALGMAFRRGVCHHGVQTRCRSCPIRKDCPYARIFETTVDGKAPPLMGGSLHAPRPLVVEPRSLRRHFGPGDALDFDLLLFGEAARYHPLIALAVERMAHHGLGARRAPFSLDSFRFEESPGTWLAEDPGPQPSTSSLLLHFLTPTRLLVHKRLERHPSFRTLAFKMARRVLELAHFHAPKAPSDWDLQPLLDLAESVRIRRDRLRWHELQRYSNRQKRKIDAGGLVGTLELEGNLTPFRPLLRAASVVHFGKGTSFGLGRMGLGGNSPPDRKETPGMMRGAFLRKQGEEQ